MSESNQPQMVVLRRRDALSEGALKYFTGKPCKGGHIAERYAKSGKCVVCCRLDFEKSYAENRDKWLDRSREWARANPDKVAEKTKKWRVNNPEAVRELKRKIYLRQKDSGIGLSQEQIERRRKNERAYKERHRDKINAKSRHVYQEKREEILSAIRLKHASIREYIRARSKAWQQKNPASMAAKKAKRRAAESSAVPVWFGELDALVAIEAVSLAKHREEATGFPWEVDHMLPIRAKKVCGLHVWNNLQVIPKHLNQKKSNSEILTMPGQWIAVA